MARISRRSVLRLTALGVPAAAIGCGSEVETFDPEAVPESTDRFPRTPIAGDMTTTRVVLTFFVADDSAVTLRVWTGDGEIVVDEAVAPSGDGFHKVRIDDLTPGNTYQYAVFGGEAPEFADRSLIGQVRTAPADDDSPPVRVALLCCVGQGTVLPDWYMPADTPNPTLEPFHWEVFTHAGDKDLDALIHLGDQAYLDMVWSMQGGTVEAYQNAWGYYHGGGYRDLYPLAGLYATWDDHESTDNSDFDPWNVSAEDQVKLDNAKTVWYRTLPIDADTPADGPVWRGFRWGGTVEILLLDCRYELTADALVSADQLDWLVDRITNSPCRFVCVATPRPFSRITTSSPLLGDNADRWEAMPADRARVEAAIDAVGTRRVIFVAGDIHMNYFGRVTVDGTRASDQCWELCCTSGNVQPAAAAGLSPDQFEFVAAEPHFPVLTFDAEAGTVHVQFYDRSGALAFEKVIDDA